MEVPEQPRSQGPLLLSPLSRYGGWIGEDPGNEVGARKVEF